MKCFNPLIVHNHNLGCFINDYFAKNPKGVINKEEFMKIQLLMWRRVKVAFESMDRMSGEDLSKIEELVDRLLERNKKLFTVL